MEIIIVLLITAVAISVVFIPALRGGTATHRASPGHRPLLDDAAIDEEVERYRSALRAGTLCAQCRFANPAGSRYCADCGHEFEDGTEE